MKCYNCGCTLSTDDFCTACGADVKTYKRIIRLSNRYYNEGLKKAKIRDLTGAVSSLRLSLKCNKNNVQARNLLGLVLFETGEIVPALSEWIVSKNIRDKKNIADDFLSDIRNNQAKLSGYDTLIRKYNQALSYAQHDDLDLAVIQLKSVVAKSPAFLRAVELLSLIYLKNEDWVKARKCAERGLKTDAGNTRLKTYLAEAEKRILEKDNASGRKPSRRHKDEAISYTSGNETIIQPLNDSERSGSQTIINILIGLLAGAALMWFLVLPARIQVKGNDVNARLKEVSEELTKKTADMDELNERIEALQEESKGYQDALSEYTGNEGVMEDYNNLLTAALSYINDPDDALGAAESLEKIKETQGKNVSTEFTSLYDYLSSNVSTKAAEQYLKSGTEKYNKGDYEGAINDLTEACDLNKESDEALYYLAQSYLKNDNKDKATELFNQLISSFPDSEYKSKAESFINQGEEDNEEAVIEVETPVPEPNPMDQTALQAALAAAQAQQDAAAEARQNAEAAQQNADAAAQNIGQ